MLYVAMRRPSRRSWRAAKATFVAMRRVGVGPGTKMELQRSSKKVAIGRLAAEVGEGGLGCVFAFGNCDTRDLKFEVTMMKAVRRRVDSAQQVGVCR